MSSATTQQPIENYGVIGDLRSLALVGMDGSIDFLCWPRFDSPTLLAALLNQEKGGHFQLHPFLNGARHKQLYLPDTNILLTRFLEPEGVAEVSDFMWIRSDGTPDTRLVRRAETVQGELAYGITFAPRFGYARAGHRVEETSHGLVFVPDDRDQPAMRLRSPNTKLTIKNGDGVAGFRLEAGRTASFILEEAEEGRSSPAEAPDFVAAAFKETANYWTRWIGRSTIKGAGAKWSIAPLLS